jgi:hypothetical protein
VADDAMGWNEYAERVVRYGGADLLLGHVITDCVN